MGQRVRYLISVPCYYIGEVAAFTVGATLLVALACFAMVLLALAVVGFTVSALREEVGAVLDNLRDRRTRTGER